jgi:hypothetical protein
VSNWFKSRLDCKYEVIRMYKKIGSLPPSLQGIALELKINERVGVITGEHPSEKYGEHEDVYTILRTDKDTVFIAKFHTCPVARNVVLDKPMTQGEIDENFGTYTYSGKC